MVTLRWVCAELHTIAEGILKNFKNPFPALNFCTAFEEIRQFFKKIESRAGNRRIFASKFKEFVKLGTDCI